MVKKSIRALSVALVSSIAIAVNVGATGVSYLPGVTKEMSEPSYWTNESEVLMSAEEIEELNQLTVAQTDTHMYDLKNQPKTVDGISLNEALLASAKADVAYYLGWTYIEGDTLATEEEFAPFIDNTQNPNAEKEQAVRYGIAVHASELRAFPTNQPIYDDLNDKDFDYQYLSGIRVNEPLVITSVSADGNYYLAKNSCCSGWIAVEDVAICADKTQWLSAWDIPREKVLTVYGDRVYTETSAMDAFTSGCMLTMGTVLEQADVADPNVLINNRAAYQNYVVWIPIRNADGSYAKKSALIAEHNKVHDGYLPLTKANIVKVAFSALGNIYGWGGNLNSDDCSEYIRNIYKCFGLELARNTVWQSSMPMAKADMRDMCREERIAVLDTLPLGSILYFNGHAMLYLGKENGNYYVVSAIHTIMQPENFSTRQGIRSVVVNTLDVRRANGKSWMDNLTTAVVPYQSSEHSVLPATAWYHNGVAFCLNNKLMQGDEDGMFRPDDNITFAEFLQILYNKEGNPAVTSSDTANKTWYDDALTWAQNARLIFGDAVYPETDMTREELAVIIYRYAVYQGINIGSQGALNAYADIDSVSANAVSAMEYVIQNGIMTGKAEHMLQPNDNTTRAEVATILERFENRMHTEER